MNCAEIQERLEAYSLDLLAADERAAVLAHLAVCSTCQQLAAEYADTLAMLPLAVAVAAPQRPPAALRNRVFSAIQEMREIQEIQVTKTREGSATVTPLAAAVPAASIRTTEVPIKAETYEPSRQAQPTSKPRFRIMWAAALLLTVLLLALGTGLTLTLARENALMRQLVALSGQQQMVLEVVDSPKTTKVHLRPPTGEQSTAYGKIYIRPDLPDVVMTAVRLPPAPMNQSYHLWITTNNHNYLLGVLAVNNDGFALLTYRAKQPGLSFDTAKLTLQPSGSNEPGGTVVLVGQPDPKATN